MVSAYAPQRVACLQPSATVILDCLGMLDRVVACTKWCLEVCPRAGGRLIVNDSWSASAAELLAAGPDLVIASVPYRVEALAEILKSGCRFLGLATRTLEDVYRDIAAIAGVMQAAEAGARVIAEMQAEVERVRAATTGTEERPRVFCEEWGKPIIHSQPWVAELVEAAGGEFVGRPGAQTTAEAVSALDPDLIIAAWCGAGDRVPLDRIVRERGWNDLRAACSGRVYCIPDEYLNTPAPTLLLGLRALAGILHPQLFPADARVRALAAQTM